MSLGLFHGVGNILMHLSGSKEREVSGFIFCNTEDFTPNAFNGTNYRKYFISLRVMKGKQFEERSSKPKEEGDPNVLAAIGCHTITISVYYTKQET